MERKNGNVLIVILFILLLATTSTSVFLYFQNQKIIPSETKRTQTPAPTDQIPTKPQEIPKTGFSIFDSATRPGWKTFQHELGFSFDFPSGKSYEFENRSQSSPEDILYLRIYTQVDNFPPNYRGPFIEIMVFKGNEALNNSAEGLEEEPKERKINEIIFQEYTVLGMGSPHGFQTIKNNITYDFSEIFGPLPEFNTLINTVKFAK